MTANRIEVHAHLLPGVDDGCRSIDESIACARIFVESGYSHVFCTPHIWPSLPENTRERIAVDVTSLQGELDRAGVPLRVTAGAEYNLTAMWPTLREYRREQIVTCGLSGTHVLFDFWAGSIRECRAALHGGIEHLRSLGFTPILAHPERIEAFQREPEELDRLIAMGVKLQLNCWCLDVPHESPVYQTAARLMREQKYFLMGSDCHDNESLPGRLQGVQVAIDMFGEELVNKLTIENPRLLLGGQ